MVCISVILLSFAYPAFAADVSVSRSMPSRVDPQGTLTVSFTITPTGTLSNFDLAELIPRDWSIKDWSVSGIDRSSVALDTQESQAFMGSIYKGYHWDFNADISSAVTLTYTLDVPVSSGSYKFVGIWTYAGGFEKDEKTLSVAVAPTTTTTVPTTTTTTRPTGFPGGTVGLIVVAVIIILVVLFALWKKRII